MSPRKRSSRKAAASGGRSSKAIIALAVMGAIIAAYGWNSVFLGPKNRARAAVGKELSDARQKEQDLRQNMAQLRKLAADTQSRESELTRLGRLVPNDADLAGAILALDETAKLAGVNMGSLIPSPPAAAAGGPATLAVTMTIEGTFDQLYDYFSRIEALDRLVVIDSLQLAGGGGNTGNGPGPLKLAAQIKARLFAATGPAAPVTAAAPAAGASDKADTSKTAALPKAGG